MKKIAIFLIAIAATMLSVFSCKEKEDEPLNIIGTWELTGIQTKSATLSGTQVEVYIVFSEDGTFNLYQMIGQGPFNSFSGRWTLVGNVLDGKYSDGTSWGSTYEVEMDSSLSTLTLSTTGETYTYKASDLPTSL